MVSRTKGSKTLNRSNKKPFTLKPTNILTVVLLALLAIILSVYGAESSPIAKASSSITDMRTEGVSQPLGSEFLSSGVISLYHRPLLDIALAFVYQDGSAITTCSNVPLRNPIERRPRPPSRPHDASAKSKISTLTTI